MPPSVFGSWSKEERKYFYLNYKKSRRAKRGEVIVLVF